MKFRKGIYTLLVTVVIILLSIPVWAAMPSQMEIEGENQGKIDGSCILKGRENTITVFGFNHNIHIPRDPQTGEATGKRVHEPFQIIKEFDKSTPKLYQALVNGERLSNVKIRFYQDSPDRGDEHYFTIELENALITDISVGTPSSLLSENQEYGNMETVSFTYEKIKWTNENGGTASEDSWIKK